MLLKNITERVEAMEGELRKKNLLFSIDTDTQSSERLTEGKKSTQDAQYVKESSPTKTAQIATTVEVN